MLVDAIIRENYDDIYWEFKTAVGKNVVNKVNSLKARIALRQMPFGGELDETKHYVPTTRRMGRLKLIRVRIRSGKVQRRKKLSAVKGWTLRHGRLIRMRPAEKLHRRLAARRAKIKRRSKKALIHRKTVIAMRKRRNLGLRAWSAHPHYR